MRGRLDGCKLTRRVLNHEQAANEPTAYTASILNMGYFRELMRSNIFLGTVILSGRTMMQCGLSLLPQTAFHLPFLTGTCVSID